jgi:hypothetical protein
MCSRWYWKSDLANGLSRVDGPIKEMCRYQWGVYWVSWNRCHWGMEFYSADIEMLMSGWNTPHLPFSHSFTCNSYIKQCSAQQLRRYDIILYKCKRQYGVPSPSNKKPIRFIGIMIGHHKWILQSSGDPQPRTSSCHLTSDRVPRITSYSVRGCLQLAVSLLYRVVKSNTP